MLMEEADALGYPGKIFSVGIQMNMAPRGLRCYAHCTGLPSNRKLQGATFCKDILTCGDPGILGQVPNMYVAGAAQRA